MRHAANIALLSSLQDAHNHLTRIIDLMAAGNGDFLVAQEMQALVAGLGNSRTLLVVDQIERHWEQLIRGLPATMQVDLPGLANITKYL